MPLDVKRNERLLVWSLARRLLTHGENKFARFVTWVSFIGLTLGVTILTVVITVMNGFDHELKTRLLKAIPHVTIADVELDHPIYNVAATMPGVTSVHEYFQGFAAISVAGQVQPIKLYGVNAHGLDSLDYLSASMRQGKFDDLAQDPNGIIIGTPLARYLGLEIGDPVVVLGVESRSEGVAPKLLRFTLQGSFELGAEPDYGLAIVNLDRQPAQAWQAMGERGLQVQLLDPLRVQEVAADLSAEFRELQIDTWISAYGELFQAVRLEKSMMFLLLLLVVAIASFNIIAGQTMVVNDKRASIAILRTMGTTEAVIRNVFLLQGICIGVGGTVIGLALGILCSFNINSILAGLEVISGMHLLDGSFFVEVPVLVLPADLLLIAAMSCGLCLLSAWFPARRASLMDPVQALH